jgi:hypothetical protein
MQWGKKVRKILVRRNCKVNVGLGKEMCGECTEEKFRKVRRMRLEKLEKIFKVLRASPHSRLHFISDSSMFIVTSCPLLG